MIGGQLIDKGMPQFPDISLEDANAIHAYLINQAWAGYEAQQARAVAH